MKNINYIFISTFISSIGDGMFYIATSWFIYDIMKTSLAVGILMAFSLLPIVLVFPFSGTLADRANKKRIVLGMDLFRGFIIAFCAIVIYFFVDSRGVALIYLLTALAKIGDCFFSPCITGIIKETFHEDEYVKIFSTNSTLQQIGTIIGSSITGILITVVSLEVVFVIDSISFFISACCLSQLNYKEKMFGQRDKKQSILVNFRDGIEYTVSNKGVLSVLILAIVPIAVVNMLNTLLSAHTVTTLGLSVKYYGFLDSVFGIGCSLMGVVLSMATYRNLEKKSGIYGYLILALGLGGLGISHGFYDSFVFVALIGVGVMLVSVNMKTLMAKRIAGDYIGRVDSLSYTVNSVITAGLGIVVAYLAGIMGTRIAFMIYSAGCIVAYVSCKVMVSRHYEQIEEIGGV